MLMESQINPLWEIALKIEARTQMTCNTFYGVIESQIGQINRIRTLLKSLPQSFGSTEKL